VVVRYATKEGGEAKDGQGSLSKQSFSLREINSQIVEHYYRPHLAPPLLKLSINVKNTGRLDGDEVVMLYVMPPPGLGAPRQNLRNYRRVHLRVGETTSIDFDVTSHDLAFAQADGKVGSAIGRWQIQAGSAPSVTLRVSE
jgi:hypothetical protein